MIGLPASKSMGCLELGPMWPLDFLLAYFERTRIPLTSFIHSFRFSMMFFSSAMLKPVSFCSWSTYVNAGLPLFLDKMLYFPFQFNSICFQVKGRIWHKIRNLRALFYALICPCCLIASKSERWCKINTVNPRWHLQGFHLASEIGEFSVYFAEFSDLITYDCFILRCGTFLKLLP